MMSHGNEKSGFGVYIRPAFWLSAFFADRIIYLLLKQKPPQG